MGQTGRVSALIPLLVWGFAQTLLVFPNPGPLTVSEGVEVLLHDPDSPTVLVWASRPGEHRVCLGETCQTFTVPARPEVRVQAFTTPPNLVLGDVLHLVLTNTGNLPLRLRVRSSGNVRFPEQALTLDLGETRELALPLEGYGAFQVRVEGETPLALLNLRRSYPDGRPDPYRVSLSLDVNPHGYSLGLQGPLSARVSGALGLHPSGVRGEARLRLLTNPALTVYGGWDGRVYAGAVAEAGLSRFETQARQEVLTVRLVHQNLAGDLTAGQTGVGAGFTGVFGPWEARVHLGTPKTGVGLGYRFDGGRVELGVRGGTPYTRVFLAGEGWGVGFAWDREVQVQGSLRLFGGGNSQITLTGQLTPRAWGVSLGVAYPGFSASLSQRGVEARAWGAWEDVNWRVRGLWGSEAHLAGGFTWRLPVPEALTLALGGYEALRPVEGRVLYEGTPVNGAVVLTREARVFTGPDGRYRVYAREGEKLRVLPPEDLLALEATTEGGEVRLEPAGVLELACVGTAVLNGRFVPCGRVLVPPGEHQVRFPEGVVRVGVRVGEVVRVDRPSPPPVDPGEEVEPEEALFLDLPRRLTPGVHRLTASGIALETPWGVFPVLDGEVVLVVPKGASGEAVLRLKGEKRVREYPVLVVAEEP